jgi:hypothetical protein
MLMLGHTDMAKSIRRTFKTGLLQMRLFKSKNVTELKASM